MLRWVPADAETWRAGIKNGYRIERFTADAFFDLAGQDPAGKGVNVTPAPILPLPETDTAWNRLMRQDQLNAFVFHALYGVPATAADPQKKKTEEQLQFGLALKACDLSPATAKAHGLFFTDRDILPGQIYVYRISLANDQKKVGTAIADEKLSVLRAPAGVKGDFRNKRVMITFDFASTREQYAGYIIERSEDSLHFLRVNPVLFVLARSQYETNKTEAAYRDSFAVNNKLYWYRVRGFSYFGIEGPASQAVRGKGKDEWSAYPEIDSLFSPDNKRAELKWHLPVENARLQGFLVLRAASAAGPYVAVHQALLSKQVSSFYDKRASFTNYYMVAAISTEGDTAFSYPAMLQLSDNEPPPVPENLSGVIDTNGVVWLSWNNVSAADLKGYRVFRCNSLREEFYEVSDSILSTSMFADTTTLQTLTREIYYCVRSVDRMYNNSEPCFPLRLKRPDKIPPIPPVPREAVHTDSTILLRWINSTSEDIMCLELKRNGVVVASFSARDTLTVFCDPSAVPGNDYQYSFTATDSSGNSSSAEFPAVRFTPRIYPALKNVQAETNREARTILLSWNTPAQAVDRYIIYKAKKGESFRSWKTINGKVNSITDKELYPNNIYCYRVKAVLKNGAETRMVEMEVEY
jgi:hypothetical protein